MQRINKKYKYKTIYGFIDSIDIKLNEYISCGWEVEFMSTHVTPGGSSKIAYTLKKQIKNEH